MSRIQFGIFCLFIILLLAYSNSEFSKVRAGTSPVREWNVIASYDNKAEAAALLAKTNTIMIDFFRQLKKKYHIDESDDVIAAEVASHTAALNTPGDIYNIIDHLLNNYNPDVFYENDPRYSNDTSYTVNKGQTMYVCLRQKDDPRILVDENTLLFVFLHEITHNSNYRGWGHGKDFWTIFKTILHEAKLAGIYSPIDYSKYPVNYCGLKIDYSPYFDTTLPNLWVLG